MFFYLYCVLALSYYREVNKKLDKLITTLKYTIYVERTDVLQWHNNSLF